THDGRIIAKLIAPQRITNDHHGWPARSVLFWVKHPPNRRLHIEGGEHIGRHRCAMQLNRLVTPRKYEIAPRVKSYAVEDRLLGAPIDKVRPRNRPVAPIETSFGKS